MSRKTLSLAIGICLLAGVLQASGAEGLAPVRIGEINSYSSAPAYAVPYRNGWQLALDEINAAGGINGRPLEVVSRDDGGERKQAVLVAQNLILRDRVDILVGTYLSDIGLAVSNVASQNRKVFIAGSPLSDSLTLDKGNRYTFRLRPSTFMQAAMLVEAAARLPVTRWATLAPNYEYGQSAVASFKQLLKARRPDVQFVAEQWPALGKLDAPSAVHALRKARPQAIFSAAFGADLAGFVREGQRERLFDGVSMVSMLGGEPENLEAFENGASTGAGAGRGWLVSGYPVEQMRTAEQARFIASYEARYHTAPRLGSLVGYMLMQTVAAAVRTAGTADSEKMIVALRGLQLPTPVGMISFRAIDQQSTMGTWVGRLDHRDGHVQMRDWHYADGRAYLPPDAWVRTQRPAAAMR